MSPKNPSIMGVALIGLGKAGQSLLNAFQSCERLKVDAIFSRSPKPSLNHLNVTSCWKDFVELIKNQSTKAIFLAVPDHQIIEVTTMLLSFGPLPSWIIHLSGASGIDHFADFSGHTHFASFHPLGSLRPNAQLQRRTLVAIEAQESDGFDLLEQICHFLHLVPIRISSKQKSTYHAAATLTGSLSYGLVKESIDLLQACGLSRSVAQEGLAHLLQSVAQNLQSGDLSEVATGPIVRGDHETIKKHLQALSNDPQASSLYRLLSLSLLSSGNLPSVLKAELETLLRLTALKSPHQ